MLHVLANLGDALVAALLVAKAGLDAPRLIFQQRIDRVCPHGGQRADLLRGSAAGRRAEHEAFRQRVRAEPVGAVEADVRALARRVKALHGRGARDVRVDAAHLVVLHRPHRNGVFDDVDAHILAAELAHERQLSIDDLLAEMANVEVHVLAVRALESLSLFELGGHGAADDVARTELHLGGHVALQKALALIVEQVTALAANRLGDEDAGEGQTGRMELNHLHVLHRHAGAVSERHAVAGADVPVGGEGVDAAEAPGGEDRGPGGDGVDLAGAHVDGRDAHAPAVLHEQLGDERLVVAVNGVVLEAGLEERVQHVEAGLVGGEDGAPGAHAPEGPHRDGTVGVAAPRAAPVLHLHDLDRGLPHERLHHVLVREVVGALDGVEGVRVVAVVRGHHGRGAALGRD